MKIGILVPHIFMQDAVLSDVIFAPAQLAIELAEQLQLKGHEVTLFSPGKVTAGVRNVNSDLSLFEQELKIRGDTYISLLRKHPFTFITMARQVQNELVAKAMKMANDNQLDLLHVYTNEEESALVFSDLCQKPVAFTHHDPYNFLIKYKNFYPKYSHKNWISISLSQRRQMPPDTNWTGNVYHGLPKDLYKPDFQTGSGYVAYLGRIINTKGVHLAIEAVQKYNAVNKKQLKLKIAGKHYAGHKNDPYWDDVIEPKLADPNIEYVGFLKSVRQKQDFLAGAKGLIIPSLFEEPFGMVMIEALACATPVIGLDSGAVPEIIKDGETGYIVKKTYYKSGKLDEVKTASDICARIDDLDAIDRKACRTDFEKRFTAARMAQEHTEIYRRLIKG